MVPAEPPLTLSADQSQVPVRPCTESALVLPCATIGRGEGRTAACAGAAVDLNALGARVDGDGVRAADEVDALFVVPERVSGDRETKRG